MKMQVTITSNGFDEVNKTLKKKKPFSVMEWALFLAMLEESLYNGYTYEQNIQATIMYNAQQMYKQVVLNTQQNKELKIDSDEFQRIIKQQNNQKLNINGDKISGSMDLTMIGLNNMAKVEGIKEIAEDDSKVKFIAVEDNKTTLMCDSLNNQEFYINKENEFDRYYGETSNELRVQRIKCKGLVVGLNLPPISHHFHWCRSTIQYLSPIIIEKNEISWYNKLGNSNKNNVGGTGKGIFIEKIDIKDIDKKIREYEEEIRNMLIEYGIVIDEHGNVFAYTGTETNLNITDRSLDNVILTHNHPEVGSFGKDDYVMLYDNPKIKELRAVDKEYTYSLKLKKPLDKTYTNIYNQSGDIMINTGEENQHCVMLKLREMGYVKYDRERKK